MATRAGQRRPRARAVAAAPRAGRRRARARAWIARAASAAWPGTPTCAASLRARTTTPGWPSTSTSTGCAPASRRWRPRSADSTRSSFTGGVGEHAPRGPRARGGGLGFLGVALDAGANAQAGADAEIGAAAAPARALVVTAREDLEVARQVARRARGLAATVGTRRIPGECRLVIPGSSGDDRAGMEGSARRPCWSPKPGSRRSSSSCSAGSSSSACSPTAPTWPIRRCRDASSISRAASLQRAATSPRASRSSCTTGLMEYGSAFGHGAYLGPDFTADYLRRSADLVKRSYGGSASDWPRAGRSRTSAPTATTSARRHSTLTAPQAQAFRGSCRTTAASSRTRRPTTGCVPNAITTPRSCAS